MSENERIAKLEAQREDMYRRIDEMLDEGWPE